jgi:hypothetical protein
MAFGSVDAYRPSAQNRQVIAATAEYTRPSAGTAAASPSASAVKAMHDLIGLQTFSGAWAWDAKVFEAMEVNPDDVKLPGNDKDADATALAVAYLENKVASKRDVWEMVVEKARNWLAKQLGLSADGVDMVKEAAKYL